VVCNRLSFSWRASAGVLISNRTTRIAGRHPHSAFNFPLFIMLAQLTTVKSRLEILDTDTTYDDLLTNAIKAVSARFDGECNRTLVSNSIPPIRKFPALLAHRIRFEISNQDQRNRRLD
jgi:hypothetical protein